MNWLHCFIKAVLAGMLISVGGIVFLMSDYKIVGAVLFAVGLFTIMTYELNLYTEGPATSSTTTGLTSFPS